MDDYYEDDGYDSGVEDILVEEDCQENEDDNEDNYDY